MGIIADDRVSSHYSAQSAHLSPVVGVGSGTDGLMYPAGVGAADTADQ